MKADATQVSCSSATASANNFSFFPVSIFLIMLMLIWLQVAAAQNTGFPPFNSFQNAQFDSINLANLNIHFGADIEHKAGRGTPFDYVLSYDSLIWTIVNNTWTPVTGWGGAE